MFPVSDLMIRIIPRKRLVRPAHQIAGFVLDVTLRSRPVYHQPALCDYCEFWEMCSSNVLSLIIVSTPESVLNVVGRRLRHLMELSAHSSHVSVW